MKSSPTALAPARVSVSIALPKCGAQKASGSSFSATSVSSSIDTNAVWRGS
jgi:hypothetical protein